ncbi:hypothetical protein E2562_024045 [Oryza meyeriana var. granulata]|uniref:Uncharacterized protein n=1 Tax=Oryza meyeriana var. granulata TaxID=110450 RepID=A0A6G1CR26_9ORYZ|nr:hypothetical protein E2562_024045 [Oryza meyeriana var. granulata]KAF0903055.1 hypothetical protein E2562_024045 [Oryza meyeriana var. granulata]KAF0903060.1 hypothetical protein E2562_024045 [Oryza meyeriana var. granulata]
MAREHARPPLLLLCCGRRAPAAPNLPGLLPTAVAPLARPIAAALSGHSSPNLGLLQWATQETLHLNQLRGQMYQHGGLALPGYSRS